MLKWLGTLREANQLAILIPLGVVVGYALGLMTYSLIFMN